MTAKTPRAASGARAATISLGGDARAHPDLEPLIRPLFGADLTPTGDGSLVPLIRRHPANPRRGDHDAIVKSIRNNGVYSPIKVQRSTGYVLAGNHTLDAILDQGGTSAPWVWLDVDDDEARRIMLDDNHVGDLGGYDDRMLLESLRAAEAAGDLLLSSYTVEDIAEVEAAVRAASGPQDGLNDPDEAPDLPEGPPISHTGDVWRLGPHRLVVGDATDGAAYDALLDGEQAACVWTDPPYGVDYQTNLTHEQAKSARRRTDGLTVSNDAPDGVAALLEAALPRVLARSEPGAAWYVTAPQSGHQLASFLGVLGVLRQTLIWVKDAFVLGRSDYQYSHEPILYGRTPSDGNGRFGRMGGQGWYGPNNETSVWAIPRPRRSPDHPTMKPVELVARALRNSTRPGDLVLDPFAGSGTTLIACHQQDRTARLIELDPRYADVICRRYQQHTGTVPVRDGQPVDFTV